MVKLVIKLYGLVRLFDVLMECFGQVAKLKGVV